MKLADRILGLSEAVAVPDNPDYEHYRKNVHRVKVGVAVGLGGLAARATGLEPLEAVGYAAMALGATGAYFSGVAATEQVMNLTKQIM